MARADFYESFARWRATPAAARWNFLPLCCFASRSHSGDRLSPSDSHVQNGHLQIDHCQNQEHSSHYSNRLVIFDQRPNWQQSSTLLVSSRYPSADPLDQELAEALRTWLASASSASSRPMLISGEGMTLDAMLVAVTPTFQIPLVRLVPPRTKNVAHWLKQFSTQENFVGQWIQPVYISPSILDDSKTVDPDTINLDSIAFDIADQIQAFYLKPNSKTGNLVSQRLSQFGVSRKPSRRTQVWIPSSQLMKRSRRLANHHHQALELMEQGAVGWYLPKKDSTNSPAACSNKTLVQQFPCSLSDQFLFHHTRRCSNAWPEETEEERWIRWLHGNQSVGALQTLFRILTQGRLRANGKLIPSGKPMVCFSQRRPQASVAARSFRSHLSRWDYEPYGVAVRKETLIERGARAVVYREQDRAPCGVPPEFTQKRFTVGAKGKKIDWSEEQEFRLAGDLDFYSLSADDLIFFVPTCAEAARLATVSRWSIGFLEPKVKLVDNDSES